MQATNLFSLFTSKLNALAVEYMITGSVAATAYGEPRLTNDLDIVLLLLQQNITTFHAAFPSPEYSCPPEEVLQIECRRQIRGHFNLIHFDTGFKADIYLAGEDSFQLWGLKNRVATNLLGSEVSLAPPEYVIIKKLQFFREGGSEKHLRDIKGMLCVSGQKINLPVLEEFLRKFRVEDEWDKLKKFLA